MCVICSSRLASFVECDFQDTLVHYSEATIAKWTSQFCVSYFVTVHSRAKEKALYRAGRDTGFLTILYYELQYSDDIVLKFEI